MSVLDRINRLLESIQFEKVQKEYLQHHIINKMTSRSVRRLQKEINATNKDIISLNRKDAQEIIEILYYIRNFLVDL